ncbi:diguanylate cyclase [Marinimicrobium sp. ABcell2]|uniref:diguanylate cyclase n=1 Tax=Marinimicrobium sp. ABcell2 TaxID=3069751 RepID=UPI0027B3E6EC|nr:diguanylate cyclase [Marinimicrobium sp. ABcell2]MDQ2077973.1 diguanylate cyclase [Marinimicrobium sp. ABcell2]
MLSATLFTSTQRLIRRLVYLSVAGLVFASVSAQATPLRMVDGREGINAYAKGLLELVLSKVPQTYEWDESTGNTTETRIIQMLNDGELDIVWYATTEELETSLQPIRVPMYRGLLGYRVLMIKRGTQHRFDHIETLEDLQEISLGQGRFWADTEVLTANGLNVVKVIKYEGLFFMLDGDRFDAFPRGAHEPWQEIQERPDLELEVERNLLLVYTNPFYFFVSRANPELARNLEQGFRIAMEDGSFNEYFFNDSTVQDVVNKANLENRTIIRLENPTLPEATPVDQSDLWFDPTELSH